MFKVKQYASTEPALIQFVYLYALSILVVIFYFLFSIFLKISKTNFECVKSETIFQGHSRQRTSTYFDIKCIYIWSARTVVHWNISIAMTQTNYLLLCNSVSCEMGFAYNVVTLYLFFFDSLAGVGCHIVVLRLPFARAHKCHNFCWWAYQWCANKTCHHTFLSRSPLTTHTKAQISFIRFIVLLSQQVLMSYGSMDLQINTTKTILIDKLVT